MAGGIEQTLHQFKLTMRRCVSANQPKTQEMLIKQASKLLHGKVQFRPFTVIEQSVKTFKDGQLLKSCVDKFKSTAECVFKDTMAVGAQKTKRSITMLNLQKQLHGDKSFYNTFRRIAACLRSKKTNPLFALCSAACFQWEEKRISDSELDGCVYL